MKRLIVGMTLTAFTLALGCGEEPQPKPPLIAGPMIECAPGEGDELELVERISVEVTDEDDDLLPASVVGLVNGIEIELADPDADEVFTWEPPSDWDPMACGGEFTLIVEAEDAAGNTVRETFDVSS